METINKQQLNINQDIKLVMTVGRWTMRLLAWPPHGPFGGGPSG
jgi:hypothetical protein